MDTYLGVNVYDAHDQAIPGADVTFKVKFKGEDKVLGPVRTQGIKDTPASIQIPSQIDDPVVEVTASYEGHSKSVLVDTRQTRTTIIILDVVINVNNNPDNPPTNKPSGGGAPTPLEVLNLARQAVPAVNYALGVAGIAAAGAIITLFLGWTKASIVLIVLIFIGMVLLFLFSQLVISKSRSNQIAGAVLLWAVLLFFISFLVFTVTAFAGEWPRPWATFLGITPSASAAGTSASITNAQNTKPKIPGGTGWVFLGYRNGNTFSEGPKAEVVTSNRRARNFFFEIGDTIRLRLPSKVYIVDYATTKTDKNLTAPIKKGIISIADETGVVLPGGTELILRDVKYGAWPGNPNEAIWGRVVYADEN
jgi:hypothetical protein